MSDRAERRTAAANRAKAIVSEYTVPVCGCEHCSPNRHARSDFIKMARELKDPNGMTDTDLWIAWKEKLRGGPGYW